MPDFRDILLEGIGLPKFPSMEGQSDSRGKRKHDKCDRSEDIFGSEPYAKRYRQIWEILQPPFSGFSTDFSSVAWASSPPKLSRYEKLGQTESMESVYSAVVLVLVVQPKAPVCHFLPVRMLLRNGSA